MIKPELRRAGRALLPVLLLALAACGGESPTSPSASAAGAVPAPSFLTANVVTRAFGGGRDRYTVVRTATGFNITDRTGVIGTISVTNTQVLAFEDATVNLTVGDQSREIADTDLKLLVELYIAFFNRIPDADGMSYWIGQRKGGQGMDQIAESFYGAAVSPDFTALTGYAAGMTNADFVTRIYKNVLGRDTVDADGMNYWTASLASGKETRGSLVRTILTAAHAYKGDATYGPVADLLDNKYAVGSYFAIQQGLTFAGAATAVYTKSAAIAAKVTATDTAAARAAFPITDSSFDLRVPAPVPVVPTFATIRTIIDNRCVDCHNNSILNGGVSLVSEAQVRAQAANIYNLAAISDFMPQGNATGMTQAERDTIAAWFKGGRP